MTSPTKRNYLIAAVTAVVVGLGITFQIVATQGEEVKGGETRPSSAVSGSTWTDLERVPDGTKDSGDGDAISPTSTSESDGQQNDQTGKPGEVKGG